jgi:hypothetical protein
MMILRWTAAGSLEAKRHFRKVAGYRALPKLVAALPTASSEMIVRIESASYWKTARASPMRSVSSIIEA